MKHHANFSDNLGGQDFDSRIMKYVIEEFRKTSDYDIYKKDRKLKQLRTKCREAKEFLSNLKDSVNIHVLIYLLTIEYLIDLARYK